MGLTLAGKDHWNVPQLRHIISLKNLSLIARTVAVQRKRRILTSHIFHRETNPGTNRYLRTDNPVASIEALAEHVHGPALAEGDTVSSTEELANDGFNRGTTHQREAVAAIGSDNLVFGGDGALDTHCNGFLPGGKMAETADFFFFVEFVGGHFHSPVCRGIVLVGMLSFSHEIVLLSS